MNIGKFNRQLQNVRSIAGPLDRLSALVQAAANLTKLKAAHVPSGWAAVVKMYAEHNGGEDFNESETSRAERYKMNLFRNLLLVLKFFDAQDRPRGLDEIEVGAWLLSEKRYYRTHSLSVSLFPYLVRDGLCTLVGDAALVRFFAYAEQIVSLSGKHLVLGYAILDLTPAISHQEEAVQLICYDLVEALCNEHLSKYLTDSLLYVESYAMAAFVHCTVIQQLAAELERLALLQQPADVLGQRLTRLRTQADRLPSVQRQNAHRSIDRVRQAALGQLEVPNRRWRNVSLAYLRVKGYTPRHAMMRRMRSRRGL